MISVDIRTKNFGPTRVLKDVAFELQRGQCLAILGKSGIGKSTLLRLVAGIDPDFEGTVSRPEAMAIVFQEPTLLLWRRAIDNILIIHPRLEETAARDMLAKVGLADKADMYPRQLSLGQQRRLSLARAFAGRPELLILDEPFASLDKATAADMIALTRTLISEVAPATLFVTHEKDEARQLADRTLELAGSPATVVPDCRIMEFDREEAS
ncbi:ATP-binding cassette domain-containing protein [Roseibium sp. AS2]|uniref:ABC transporter ATP-binding protein n=1 Tax=Roseibium sp. AS2 TaxID=3135781 RepID=UPI00317B3B58